MKIEIMNDIKLKELVDILSEDKKELIDECTILQEELNNLKLSMSRLLPTSKSQMVQRLFY